MYGRSNHSRSRRSRHARKISVSARRHSLNVKPRKSPCAARHEEKSHQPSELGKVQGIGSIRGSERSYAPRIGEQRRGDAKTYHVSKRIEFASKRTFCSHRARDATVHGIERVSDSNRDGRIVKVRKAAIQRSQHGIVTTQEVCNCKRAGEDVYAAPEPPVAQGPSRFFFVSDRIYLVKFHFASMLSPPSTFCLSRTTTSASIGSQTSTRDPNRISPMRSPRATLSPSRFQHITRRAIAPAICLNTKRPLGVSTVITFCSFSTEAAERMRS